VSQSKKLRAMVLIEKGNAPPDELGDNDLEAVDWAVEYDIIHTLKEEGHDVLVLEVEDDLLAIHKFVDKWKPHIAWNLLEGFGGVSIFDQNVVAYLELLGVPYTGCNPRGLMVSRNKSLSKKVLAYHGIATPAFETFAKGKAIVRPPEFEFPIFVKSLTEEASNGISEASLVKDEAHFQERIEYIHKKIESDALAEQYIEGRELYVGVLGNQRFEAFPVWELYFGDGPGLHIATEKVKFNPEHRKKHHIDSGPAKGLSRELAEQAQEMAKESCRVLGMNGYARVDFRLSEQGKLWVLEVNANPHIGHLEDFAKSAEKAGLTYSDLLWRIMSLGMRWEPEKVSVAV
jgi:D-alanine-D-alanine ligase